MPLGITGIEFVNAPQDICPYFRKGYGALITHGSHTIGALGQIHGEVLKLFGLKQDAFLFDIDMAVLLNLIPESIVSRPLPKYPSVSRDYYSYSGHQRTRRSSPGGHCWI